jgi:hypothetical protein
MAIVTNNIAVEGLSGKMGNLVFRQLNGKTIVQAAPVRKAPYNKAQLKQQNRFKEAMAYARVLLADPIVKAKYKAKARAKGGNLNAFNVAVSEYMRAGGGNWDCGLTGLRKKNRLPEKEKNMLTRNAGRKRAVRGCLSYRSVSRPEPYRIFSTHFKLSGNSRPTALNASSVINMLETPGSSGRYITGNNSS